MSSSSTSPTAPSLSRARFGLSVGMRWMALASLSFSLMGLMVKLLGDSFPSQQSLLVRSVIDGAICLVWLRWLGIAPWGTNRRLLFVRGAAGALSMSCYFFCLTRLPLAEAQVITFLRPLLTAFIAGAFLGEGLRRNEIVGILGGLAGVTVLSLPELLSLDGRTGDPLGVIAGVGAALFGSIAQTSVRQLRGDDHYLVIIFYLMALGGLGSLPVLWLGAVWPTQGEAVLLLGVSLTAMVGQVALTHGLQLERAARAGAMSYLGLVFSLVLGYLVVGESLTWISLCGMTLILLSLGFVTREQPAPPKLHAASR